MEALRARAVGERYPIDKGLGPSRATRREQDGAVSTGPFDFTTTTPKNSQHQPQDFTAWAP